LLLGLGGGEFNTKKAGGTATLIPRNSGAEGLGGFFPHHVRRSTMKVTAFNGSPRRKGNTSLLIDHVFEGLKNEGIETELVQVGGETIHGCRACYQCFTNKDRRCAVGDDIANS